MTITDKRVITTLMKVYCLL